MIDYKILFFMQRGEVLGESGMYRSSEVIPLHSVFLNKYRFEDGNKEALCSFFPLRGMI